MTEAFTKEQDADLLFYQNGLLKKEIERLKAENGHQHDEISRLDKEIDRLRQFIRSLPCECDPEYCTVQCGRCDVLGRQQP